MRDKDAEACDHGEAPAAGAVGLACGLGEALAVLGSSASSTGVTVVSSAQRIDVSLTVTAMW